MLTWAVSFLFIAIVAALFGFIAAGPTGYVLFALFFALFIGALARHLSNRESHKQRR
jgi:uncharacterized membrane protein YtjA (UPF0391 family)